MSDNTRFEHYFVVVGRLDENGEMVFKIDDEAVCARFSEGVIWDTVDEMWIQHTRELTQQARGLIDLDRRLQACLSSLICEPDHD